VQRAKCPSASPVGEADEAGRMRKAEWTADGNGRPQMSQMDAEGGKAVPSSKFQVQSERRRTSADDADGRRERFGKGTANGTGAEMDLLTEHPEEGVLCGK